MNRGTVAFLNVRHLLIAGGAFLATRAVDGSRACYSRTLTAVAQALTTVQNGHGCEDEGRDH